MAVVARKSVELHVTKGGVLQEARTKSTISSFIVCTVFE
jgi:hypothetical protein